MLDKRLLEGSGENGEKSGLRTTLGVPSSEPFVGAEGSVGVEELYIGRSVSFI